MGILYEKQHGLHNLDKNAFFVLISIPEALKGGTVNVLKAAFSAILAAAAIVICVGIVVFGPYIIGKVTVPLVDESYGNYSDQGVIIWLAGICVMLMVACVVFLWAIVSNMIYDALFK